MIIPIRPATQDTQFVTQQSQLLVWVAQRQTLLSIYWKLSGLDLHNDNDVVSTQEELSWFAQALVDYLAQGHFSMYANLIEDIRRYIPHVQPTLNYLYSSLLSSTASLVDISDHTAKMSLEEFEASHDKMLGHFGHDWAHHLEMEDNLIKLWQDARDFVSTARELDKKEAT